MVDGVRWGWAAASLQAPHLTQRAVHCIESGAVQPKLRTIRLIQRFWQERGIAFEDLANGGFRLVVDSAVILNLDDPQASIDSVAN